MFSKRMTIIIILFLVMLVPLLLDSFGVDVYEGAAGPDSDIEKLRKAAIRKATAATDEESVKQLPNNTAWINNITNAKKRYDDFIKNLNVVNAPTNKISDATLKNQANAATIEVLALYKLVLNDTNDAYKSILQYKPNSKVKPTDAYAAFEKLIDGRVNQIQNKIKAIKTLSSSSSVKADNKKQLNIIINNLNDKIFPKSIGEMWYVDDKDKPTKAVIKKPPFPGVDVPKKTKDISNFVIYAQAMTSGVMYLSNDGGPGGKDALALLQTDPVLAWNKA